MVTKYGMSDALGKVSINYDDNGRSISSETRSLVESEVRLPSYPCSVGRTKRPLFTKMCWEYNPVATHEAVDPEAQT